MLGFLLDLFLCFYLDLDLVLFVIKVIGSSKEAERLQSG